MVTDSGWGRVRAPFPASTLPQPESVTKKGLRAPPDPSPNGIRGHFSMLEGRPRRGKRVAPGAAAAPEPRQLAGARGSGARPACGRRQETAPIAAGRGGSRPGRPIGRTFRPRAAAEAASVPPPHGRGAAAAASWSKPAFTGGRNHGKPPSVVKTGLRWRQTAPFGPETRPAARPDPSALRQNPSSGGRARTRGQNWRFLYLQRGRVLTTEGAFPFRGRPRRADLPDARGLGSGSPCCSWPVGGRPARPGVGGFGPGRRPPPGRAGLHPYSPVRVQELRSGTETGRYGGSWRGLRAPRAPARMACSGVFPAHGPAAGVAPPSGGASSFPDRVF